MSISYGQRPSCARQREKIQRRGFAKGTPDGRETEWRAWRVENGVVTLFCVDDTGAGEDTPIWPNAKRLQV